MKIKTKHGKYTIMEHIFFSRIFEKQRRYLYKEAYEQGKFDQVMEDMYGTH